MPFWDPIILLSQIISIQSLHYLTLAILLPPALSLSGRSLSFYGGPANINFIMSWQELAGRSSLPSASSIDGIYSHGTRIATSMTLKSVDMSDYGRRWIIAFTWFLAAFADVYYLYTFIRKPRLILDFTLTLFGLHIILTTYYTASFPTSLFFWLVMISCSSVVILLTEQLCVRRELSQDFQPVVATEDPEDHESEPADDTHNIELTPIANTS
ncbi:hypothetical protein M408DRAFT_59678 [Serendipita vermifera MAFF 305830]|uniref:Uncharacterized protein n=1 Tax=Serendipita vermifera MAFF 305830 TaxID=933852 RepID=A0A0C3BBB4_SERVB|nr:hypothetical protein M408DRAFT_59678 [Serendipita vermifera MAFF 305830]